MAPTMVFWIADDGHDWGRSSVDRNGRPRTPPPAGARIVEEAEYRSHLHAERTRRDQEEAEERSAWQDSLLTASLVVEPGGYAPDRQLETAEAYIAQARAHLDQLGSVITTWRETERVRVTAAVETDNSKEADVVYTLEVDALDPAVHAITGDALHAVGVGLDHAHASLFPGEKFPIPAEPPVDDGSAAARVYGEVSTDEWAGHPARRLRALLANESRRHLARIAAAAEVRGAGGVRIHGLGLGDDFVLPNRDEGTVHRASYALDEPNRQERIDTVRDLIDRCEQLPPDDISFAMYTKDEELAELKKELDSWYPPFVAEFEVRTRVRVVAAGSPEDDLTTELAAMVVFAERAIATYRDEVDRGRYDIAD